MLNKACLVCIISIMLSGFNSCTTRQGSDDACGDIHASDISEITNNMTSGPLIRMLIPDDGIIEARLAVSPQNHHNVSSPMDGFVKQILVAEGQNVRRGTLICILDHPDIYTLQSSYLETKEKINYYQQELQRKGDLSLDYAASMKSFQLAESDYRSALSLLNGYERKLNYLGIDADSIVKSGMVDDIRIYSPGSGVIISSFAETGTYLSTGDRIVEIGGLDRLMAEGRISVNLYAGFKNDSSLVFVPAMLDSLSYPAYFSGNSPVLNDDQTFQVRFIVNNRENTLYPGMTGWISRGNPEFSYFVPEESTITANEDRFMFVSYGDSLRRFTMSPGREINGLIEVKNAGNLPEGTQIINKDIKLLNYRFTENSANSIEAED
ncbi:MAG: efflux RND transporter periplasmic adaptor subunit [Bacteroidales bacterium]